MAFVGDPSVMRKWWVVLQSLRPSFCLLTAVLLAWLAAKIEFGYAPEPGALLNFWVMLGVAHGWAHELASLNLGWGVGVRRWLCA